MLITRRFVFVHLPKTGGSFVESCILELARASSLCREILDPSVILPRHRTIRQRPETSLHVPVLGTIRNPYERYVSQFEFGWWRHELPPWVDPSAVARALPRFPDITFEQFVRNSEIILQESAFCGCGRPLGLQSEQFLRFFSTVPNAASALHDPSAVTFDLIGVPEATRFLRTDHLSDDLAGLLLELGVPAREAGAVRDKPRVRPKPHVDQSVPSSDWSETRSWRDYYSRELFDAVREKEWLLLDLFPDFAEMELC